MSLPDEQLERLLVNLEAAVGLDALNEDARAHDVCRQRVAAAKEALRALLRARAPREAETADGPPFPCLPPNTAHMVAGNSSRCLICGKCTACGAGEKETL